MMARKMKDTDSEDEIRECSCVRQSETHYTNRLLRRRLRCLIEIIMALSLPPNYAMS